jgi:gas vesicle protein
MSKDSGSSFFVFILGILTGGVLGLLFAPEKGTNTRDKLSFLLDKYKKRMEELLQDIVEGKESIDNEERSKGEKIISDAKEKAEQLLDDVNDLIDQIKSN